MILEIVFGNFVKIAIAGNLFFETNKELFSPQSMKSDEIWSFLKLS